MKTEEMILENEWVVYVVVNKFPFCSRDDLLQVGMIGLLKAYQNYNPSFETKFSSYAYRYVLGEVLAFIREDKSMKVNKELLKLNRKIQQAKEVLAQRLMRVPTVSELACFLEISEELILQAEQSQDFMLSLDYALNDDDGKELSLYDAVPYNEKRYDAEILDLYNALSQLDEQDRRLIELRYFQDQTQQETSRQLGMNQVQVSRTETKILTKLRNRLDSSSKIAA